MWGEGGEERFPPVHRAHTDNRLEDGGTVVRARHPLAKSHEDGRATLPAQLAQGCPPLSEHPTHPPTCTLTPATQQYR